MTAERDRDADAETLLDGIGPAFSRLRRHTPADRKDFSRNLVLNVVADGSGETTVGTVAEELRVDPSVASRMVSDCISSGYLLRAASQSDGRRTVLRLTPEGEALRKEFAGQQRDAFERITADWPDSERLEFARLLLKYAEAGAALRRRESS
ncbi:MarR family winged helix-turn-helix transcriptional regulator [Streptomyces sp. MNU89]|uniref:MarR family winged helix-turn-helix transcriptional regulator n=1 Tax=Streptomyces sp. MNU89 TaxID=2560025 RepID=UPI001E51773E|nr:MarR family winged helix-turn-helix transcriptional regulator [Streptomyces sp. MNU89]MCC9740976.1 MarR family winged helix-turn-helix transcriptional regulator [Streptomyces sp. MNU89]